MQGAATRQQIRHLMCLFCKCRVFLVNPRLLPSSRTSLDDRGHRLLEIFGTCYPFIFQSCLQLSLLIRPFSNASCSPSQTLKDFDLSASKTQSITDRNAAIDIDRSCAETLNTRDHISENNKVSKGITSGKVEISNDLIVNKTKNIGTSSDPLSDAGDHQDTQQVGPHTHCKNPQESICFKHSDSPSPRETPYDGHEACHVKDEPCSRQSIDEEFVSSCVSSVTLILEKHGWGPQTEALLRSIARELNSEIIAKIVDGLKNAEVAFSFLQWVGSQENYQLEEEVFTKVVGKLGAKGEFEVAWAVLHYMKKYGLKVDYAFRVLVCKFMNNKSADNVVKALENMTSLGLSPTVSLYTMGLQVTLKVNAVEIAERLYKQMREIGLQLDAKLSGILVNEFGKAGMPDRALFFFREMQRDGVLPDSFVYSRLIRAFGMAGEYAKGQKFFSEMIQNKCLPVALSPIDLQCALFGMKSMEQIYCLLETLENSGHHISVHTYNTLIQYLLDEKMHFEALKAFQRLQDLGKLQPCDSQHRMAEQCEKPNKVSYSLLVCGLCEGGQLTDAIRLFREMLVKRMGSTADLCNCLLRGLSSSEGFLFEAMALAAHIARRKLIVNPETQNTFFKALKASEDTSKALGIFEMMKRSGCIESTANFHGY